MNTNNTRFPRPHASSHDLRFRNGFLISTDPLLLAPVPVIPPGESTIMGVAESLEDFPDPIGNFINLGGAWIIQGKVDIEGFTLISGSLYGRDPTIDGLVGNTATQMVGPNVENVERLCIENQGAGAVVAAALIDNCHIIGGGGTCATVTRVLRNTIIDCRAGGMGVLPAGGFERTLTRNRFLVGAGAVGVASDFNVAGGNLFEVDAGGIAWAVTGSTFANSPRKAFVGNLKGGAGDGFDPAAQPLNPDALATVRTFYAGHFGMVADESPVQRASANPLAMDPAVAVYLLTANLQVCELPSAAANPGKVFLVKSRLVGGGAFTIAGTGGDLVDGAASIVQDARGSRRVRSDGANWYSF